MLKKQLLVNYTMKYPVDRFQANLVIKPNTKSELLEEYITGMGAIKKLRVPYKDILVSKFGHLNGKSLVRSYFIIKTEPKI